MNRRAFLTTGLGAVLATPLTAEAQSADKTSRVGSLHPGAATLAAPLIAAFEKGLAARGRIKGTTVAVEYRFVSPSLTELRQAAASLSEGADILVTWGALATVAAKEAGVTRPIVFVAVAFPIALGLARSLRQPGGNFTGISGEATEETYGKRLQLLREAVPGVKRIAALAAGDDPNIIPSLEALHRTAPSLGIDVFDVTVRIAADLSAAFAEMHKRSAQALVVIAGAFMFEHRDRIAALALDHRLPSVHGLREFVAAGGLLGLGADLVVMAEQAATYVDKILRGAPPADLPVEQPARYEVELNARTAKALGLTIPQSLLLRADYVIE